MPIAIVPLTFVMTLPVAVRFPPPFAWMPKAVPLIRFRARGAFDPSRKIP